MVPGLSGHNVAVHLCVDVMHECPARIHMHTAVGVAGINAMYIRRRVCESSIGIVLLVGSSHIPWSQLGLPSQQWGQDSVEVGQSAAAGQLRCC